MNWTEALEIVLARTKHEPYRRYCADDHRLREVWRARIVAKALGLPTPETPAPTPTPAAAAPIAEPHPAVDRAARGIALTRAMRACPYRSTQGCGCQGARCALRPNRFVNHLECFDCLERYPDPRPHDHRAASG